MSQKNYVLHQAIATWPLTAVVVDKYKPSVSFCLRRVSPSGALLSFAMPLVALVALLRFAGGGSSSTMLLCYSRSLVAVLALCYALPVVVLYFATVLLVAVVLCHCGGGAADGQRPHALQPMFHNYIVQCTTIHAALLLDAGLQCKRNTLHQAEGAASATSSPGQITGSTSMGGLGGGEDEHVGL